jgi:hypothetical protein
MNSDQPDRNEKIRIAASPGCTCGSTRSRQTVKRLAPSVTPAISISHGNGVVEALHDPDAEGQLEGDLHQDHAGQRVVKPHVLQDQEHRHDQRDRRKGVQHDQPAEKEPPPRHVQPRQRVARGQGDRRHHQRGADREDQGVARKAPDRRAALGQRPGQEAPVLGSVNPSGMIEPGGVVVTVSITW